jgi:hypothetical protein
MPLWDLPSDPSKSNLSLLLGSLSRLLMESIVRVSTREAEILAFLDRADLLAEPVPRGRLSVTPNFLLSRLGRPMKFGQHFPNCPFHHMGFFRCSRHLGALAATVRAIGFLPTFALPPFGCPLEFGQHLHVGPFSHIRYPGPWGVRLRPILAVAGCPVFAVAAEACPWLHPAVATVPVAVA